MALNLVNGKSGTLTHLIGFYWNFLSSRSEQLIGDLNSLYANHPTWALNDHNGDKFEWVDCNDAQGQTLSFLKYGNLPEDTLLVACNFPINYDSVRLSSQGK